MKKVLSAIVILALVAFFGGTAMAVDSSLDVTLTVEKYVNISTPNDISLSWQYSEGGTTESAWSDVDFQFDANCAATVTAAFGANPLSGTTWDYRFNSGIINTPLVVSDGANPQTAQIGAKVSGLSLVTADDYTRSLTLTITAN